MSSEIDVYTSKDFQWCVDCRKQGQNYTTVRAGILILPFCPDCYEEFKKKVAAGAAGKVVGK